MKFAVFTGLLVIANLLKSAEMSWRNSEVVKNFPGKPLEVPHLEA
jgi:hypothetical protein